MLVDEWTESKQVIVFGWRTKDTALKIFIGEI